MKPRIMAQAQAATAASVGVNQPKVMPPMMIAGVSSGGTAAMNVEPSVLQAKAWSRPMPYLRAQ
jgi:hypothetical protein